MGILSLRKGCTDKLRGDWHGKLFLTFLSLQLWLVTKTGKNHAMNHPNFLLEIQGVILVFTESACYGTTVVYRVIQYILYFGNNLKSD